MVVTLLTRDGEYVIWVALEEGDPIQQDCSFAIGVGNNPREAFDVAKKTLDKALDNLVVLASDTGLRLER